MVFANPAVVRRINKDFIPVALKAGMVNNPPRGIEGSIYAEIGRSKPAPQGICSINSTGKVLAWTLSFDNDASIPKFLDHVASRYRESPDDSELVVAERFMKFPSRKLRNIDDNGRRLEIPEWHDNRIACPGTPAISPGTLVGTIIGRPLDASGKPVADTTRQEHYMEARLELSARAQRELARAVESAGDRQFQVPEALARELIRPAFLGQLDVNPAGLVPGSRNLTEQIELLAQRVGTEDGVRLRIEGTSHIAGEDAKRASFDGRWWEHRVSLSWYGFAEIRGQRISKVVMHAAGAERLRWGTARLKQIREPDAAHLMAGHAINLDANVRYGLFATETR